MCCPSVFQQPEFCRTTGPQHVSVDLHVVLKGDASRQPVNIFILGFLEKGLIVSIILGSQISVTHLAGWPDGILQEILFDETVQLLRTDPDEEPEDVPRILLSEVPEILVATA